MKAQPLILVLLSVYAAAADLDPFQECKWKRKEDGALIDMSPGVKLKADIVKTNFQPSNDQDGQTWYFNFCQALITPNAGKCASGVSICQQWGPDPEIQRGPVAFSPTTYLNQAFISFQKPGAIASLIHNLGAANPPDADGLVTHQQQEVIVNFFCDLTAVALTPSIEVTKMGDDHWSIDWKSKEVCNINLTGPSKLSGGWILIIVVLCVLVAYLVIGVIVNKFVRKKEGPEMIPNHEFWSSLPGLIKDGFTFVINKIRGKSGTSYSSV